VFFALPLHSTWLNQRLTFSQSQCSNRLLIHRADLVLIATVLCDNFRFKHFVERLEEKIRINDTSSDEDSEY